MILNNTQANIFKVNGGIADNFANRPTASGSFYIFYSIDTGEIYYDNGAWILIGSSAGGGVNIYNSNGTLTGNRILSGANNDLNFADLNVFKTSAGGNDVGLKLDFANGYYQFGTQTITNGIGFIVDNNSGTISTEDYISGINGFTIQMLPSPVISFGDQGNAGNNILFLVDDPNSNIKTTYQSNDIGLKLDFANQQYILGNAGTLFSIYIDDNLKNVRLGDQNINFNGTAFELDDTAQFIRTIGQTSLNGLYFDFANSIYQFGQLSGNNNTYLQIDDFNEILKTQSSGIIDGLNFDFANEIFEFGQINSANGVHIKINGSAGIDTLQTIYNNNNQGLELQLNNNIYRLGHLVGGNQTQINLDDTLQAIILESSINIPGEEIKLIINGGSSALVVTQFQQNDIGLKLDFANTNYQFGQITGGNNTYLTIDDAAAYPVQIDGANVLSNTSGSTSGQHLKIKINGVDYKIELKNP